MRLCTPCIAGSSRAARLSMLPCRRPPSRGGTQGPRRSVRSFLVPPSTSTKPCAALSNAASDHARAVPFDTYSTQDF
jgi:hypothetical protein